VGCAPYLVRDEENGYVVPYQSVKALVSALESLISDPGRRRFFGRRSLEIISNWGLEETAKGIVEALRQVKRC